MRHDFWFYLCSVFTLLTANCFVPSQAYGNLNATVTNVQIQGTLTYQGNATVTVTISRTSDLNDFSVAVTCNPPLSDIDRLGCANGGVAFPAGVNTVTTTVWANPTKSSENSTLWSGLFWVCRWF